MKRLRFYRRRNRPLAICYPQAAPGEIIRLEPYPDSLAALPDFVEEVPDEVAARMGLLPA